MNTCKRTEEIIVLDVNVCIYIIIVITIILLPVTVDDDG